MSPEWIAVVVAVVAAAASLVATLIAARAQASVQEATADAARLRELEARVAERKYETYKPMLDYLHLSVAGGVDFPSLTEDEQRNYRTMVHDFGTWISIFGSDEAVRAYQRHTQATFHGPPPIPVLFRLWIDLLLAARRDMAHPETTSTPDDVMGIRIRDVYTSELAVDACTLTVDELCEKYDWTAPWSRTPSSESPG
jgi:hypothetical protein